MRVTSSNLDSNIMGIARYCLHSPLPAVAGRGNPFVAFYDSHKKQTLVFRNYAKRFT